MKLSYRSGQNLCRLIRHGQLVDVANLLANATEEEIEEYQNNLRKVRNRTSTDLQQNVYQNRTQFIKISKEAEKLKGEMRTLRTLMAELTTALGQTAIGNAPNPMSPTADDWVPKRNANRSSVANLESMWNVQLQTLWKTVEGSQKFLPVAPGRHIVMETGQWVELDSATWKPRRPVHIVLLNDHLLVAAKKRKRVDASNHRGPVPTKLVAEECWPLQDVDMIDLGANMGTGAAREEAEERGIANAINVRVGSKTFTYRHDKRDSSDKGELLATFRKRWRTFGEHCGPSQTQPLSPLTDLAMQASNILFPKSWISMLQTLPVTGPKFALMLMESSRIFDGWMDKWMNSTSISPFNVSKKQFLALRGLGN